jgi:hypothetical protein
MLQNYEFFSGLAHKPSIGQILILPCNWALYKTKHPVKSMGFFSIFREGQENNLNTFRKLVVSIPAHHSNPYLPKKLFNI